MECVAGLVWFLLLPLSEQYQTPSPSTIMSTSTKPLICALVVSLTAASAALAQEAATVAAEPAKTTASAAPLASDIPAARSTEVAPLTLVQASQAVAKPAPAGTPAPAVPSNSSATSSVTESGGVGVREFQGDDVGQVLRLLARQAKINVVVSEAVTGTVTMRLEDVTALQAIGIIVKSKGLFMDQIDNVYYIKTGAERTAEPTESASYQFSYGRAKDVAPLLASQLSSKDVPQVDERTNTIFYRETRSNIDNIKKMLAQIDKPTKQVMIEARLVEVNANPKQSYGINWAGVVGSSTSPQTVKYGASAFPDSRTAHIRSRPTRTAKSSRTISPFPVRSGTSATTLANCSGARSAAPSWPS